MASRLPLSRLSFRWQITLLVTLVVVLFLAMLFAGSAAWRYTKSSVLNEERHGLSEIASEIARQYAGRAQTPAHPDTFAPLKDPSAAASQQILMLLSRVVLQNADGVEGGFYSAAANSLVGYPFSVPDETKRLDQGDVAVDLEAAILGVAHASATNGEPAEQILTGLRDTLLIEAAPIRDGQDVGSAWAVKRLGPLPGTNRFRTYVIAVLLGATALLCVLLTLVVVRNLQNGVRKIEQGLGALESNLGSQIPTGTDPEEIQCIILAVNRLGAALKANIEHERHMEDQLRHSERLAALGRLVARVAHEVRNPLTTIRLRLQMCQRNTENVAVFDSCRIALEEVEHLDGIVSRLLSFARPIHLQREPTAVSRLAMQRLESFRDLATQNCVRMITDFCDDGALVLLDQGRMAQVFDNVIQNAIEAMQGTGGTLFLIVSADAKMHDHDGKLKVEFRDTGRGISPEFADRVFEPFFTTKPSGTGLGLAICHELVRAHGGEIYFASKKDAGTSVRILLPLQRTELPITAAVLRLRSG